MYKAGHENHDNHRSPQYLTFQFLKVRTALKACLPRSPPLVTPQSAFPVLTCVHTVHPAAWWTCSPEFTHSQRRALNTRCVPRTGCWALESHSQVCRVPVLTARLTVKEARPTRYRTIKLRNTQMVSGLMSQSVEAGLKLNSVCLLHSDLLALERLVLGGAINATNLESILTLPSPSHLPNLWVPE